MKKYIQLITVFLIVVNGHAGWADRDQVNVIGSEELPCFPVVDVDFREEGSGEPHIVWTECVLIEGKSYWNSYYRTRDENLGWSIPVNISMDNTIERTSFKSPQLPHVAIDPDTNKASAVFYHRSYKFYLGTEQACVFYVPPIQPIWEEDSTENIPELHLHAVSGMGKHAKSPFLLYNDCSTLNGYEMNDFMVFWDQHEFWSDMNHEVYYNFRATDDYNGTPVTGWQYVKQAGNVGTHEEGPSDFEPFAVLNTDMSSDHHGDIYISTWDYQDSPDSDLILRIYMNDENDPGWLSSSAVRVPEPSKLRGSSAGYYSYEIPDPYKFKDCIGIAYIQHDVTYPFDTLRYVYSEYNGSGWEDPEIISWASEGNSRPVMGVDSLPEDDIIYIAYIGLDEQVYVARKSRTESVWLHSAVVQNGKTHSNVYLKLDPNGNGEYQVVYDELDETAMKYNVYWTKWENDGDDDYVPLDWQEY